ncbi:zinc finger protein on ecdysone puffs [Chelonus insularis]|uniref:zinc finger protein on ecdysone puffs n=1 Tax=Chelonus insularis TaxID=460826 RepID=UPI00158C54B0|nr:zinc finger protein on ecdysone puffs [Chelonus insularis]
MSFNRGTKRNSFGNRSYSRGSGGGSNVGSGSVGMGNMGSGGSSRGVNPWESGVMPGRGILPTPSNNLSLNSPQAQLVIASNLLSNLLRTQQDTQPQVPSLLSLGNNMNGPGSNYRNSQNFSGRFSDRPIRGNVKSQRSQPYNKMGNRARDGVAGRRGPSSAQQSRAQSQSGNQRMNGNQKEHRNDKPSKPNPSKQNQTGKKEQQDVKTSDNEKAETQPIAKSDENEKSDETKDESVEIKKEEGADTPMEVNESEEKPSDEADKEKEPTDSTTATKNASATSPSKKDDQQSTGKKSEARHAESRYAAVPISHMFCHVCNKHMWDGFSFENHLRGRAHQLMMDKLDESYKLRVDFMRHELKVAEEQRELSLHNSKRRGKKVSVDLSVREYCTMCDLNFYGTLSSHRKSEKHQQLKVFLHPRCGPCAKEFPSRIEYDEHCLTPSHMVNAAQTEEQKKTKKAKLPKGESEIRSAEDEEKDSGPDSKTNEKEDELPENTEYLTDIIEDMNMTKYKIPSFRYCRQNHLGLGASLVKEVQGYHCEKCRRFMLTVDDMNAHLRSITHYRNFVAEVKNLTSTTETNAEKLKEESEGQVEESKASEDDEGVECKRRKLDDSAADGSENSIKEESKENTQEDNTDASKKDGNEKYDPLEADGESEEDERQQQQQGDDKADKDESIRDQSMEAWGDGDNDNEPEVGNLLGDDEEEEPQQQQQQQQQPQQQQPQQQQQQQQQQELTTQKTQNQPPPSTPQQPTQQQNASSAIIVDQPGKRENPNSNHNNNSHGKSPRGRGFRGRGGSHQRARRSRR